jgi:hypothetical protein
MSTPIDLRKEFGHRWKIGLDEAARGRWTDPWLYTIECRNGEVFPWGDDKLAASTTGPGAVAKRLLRLPEIEAMHDGSDGATVVFSRHSSSMRAVIGLMKPRRARKASPAQLAALARGRVTVRNAPDRDIPTSDSQPNPEE